MSAQPHNSKEGGIGARIRSLRGDESQESFAKRAGITRSALANYELNRTRPKRHILEKIANAGGVSWLALSDGTASDLDELLTMLGGKSGTNKETELTPQERAIIRILRACDEKTALQVANALLSAVEESRVDRLMLDAGTLEQDINLLMVIVADGGRYLKGFTRDSITQILARLSNRAG